MRGREYMMRQREKDREEPVLLFNKNSLFFFSESIHLFIIHEDRKLAKSSQI
jgi:hypothetical protein